jgi:hypothetical protein
VSSRDLHDDDQLSAYLDGDLDQAQAAELETRLAQDPALATALDAVGEVLVALRGLDAVNPPSGYAERLRARLAKAREASPAPPVHQPPRRRNWRVVASTAAAITLLGLLGTAVMRGRMPVPEAAQAPPEAQLQRETADAGPVVRLPALSVPHTAIIDAETPLADEAAVRAHLAALRGANSLLGIPIDRVPELADAARRTIMAAPPFRSGATPGMCLDSVEQAGLVAQVESVTYQQQPTLAYVVASASSGASRLDQVHIILVDPRTCEERLFL